MTYPSEDEVNRTDKTDCFILAALLACAVFCSAVSMYSTYTLTKELQEVKAHVTWLHKTIVCYRIWPLETDELNPLQLPK